MICFISHGGLNGIDSIFVIFTNLKKSILSSVSVVYDSTIHDWSIVTQVHTVSWFTSAYVSL
jgi:hypothetical protein